MAVQQKEVTVGDRDLEIGPQQAYYLLDEEGVARKKLKLVAIQDSVAHAVVCGGVGERIRLENADTLVREGRLVEADHHDGPVESRPRAES